MKNQGFFNNLLGGVGGFADGTNSDARFYRPSGVAVNASGIVFVADDFNRVIRQVAPIGTNWVVTTIAGLPGVAGTIDGVYTNARFFSPIALTIDDQGTLYASDLFAVRTIAPVGTNWEVQTIARFGQMISLPGGLFALSWTAGLAADHHGNVFAANTGFSVIQKLSRQGAGWTVTTIAGTNGVTSAIDGTNSDATFDGPVGIAIDDAENLYVADTANDTIRKLTPSGTNWVVTTIGGLAGIPGLMDGYGTNALFNYPEDVALDTQNNMYIADRFNNVVRVGRLPPSLQITRSSAGLVLSWPVWGGGFVVESANSIGPGAAWTQLGSGTLGTNGFGLTNSPASPATFFRLHSTQ